MWALPPMKGTHEMTLRQTAAARLINEDFQIQGRIGDLENANEAFSIADEQRLTAQREYDKRKAKVDHEKQVITEGLTSHLLSSAAKVTQAEIDRKVKSELFDNDVYRDLEEKLAEAKWKLDEASSAYEMARIHHRTVVTILNASAAAINFLSASKTARAIALQNLADV
jgi:hypothetical protein